MNITTIGDLRILTPELDPRDLDLVEIPPDDDLIEAKVDGAAWPNLALRGGRVHGSHLIGVDLTGANWRNARVSSCEFERVDLSGAVFSGETFDRCRFVGCRLTGVRFSDVTLNNVLFEECRLDYANFDAVRCSGPVGFLRCNLADAVLTECRLATTVVASCGLAGAELRDCDLRGADLRRSDLAGLTGLESLRGVTIDEGQLADLMVLTVRELSLTVVPGEGSATTWA
jgi:uncharacterized protein YjbI with pentapeptide repeats